MDASVRVDLGYQLAGPERETAGPCAEYPEEGVDEMFVADHHGGEEVGSHGGSCLLVGETLIARN